ncbi:alanine--tRNA ligase [Anaplasma phagocytophilum]|uniref:alanine--tRNA ligase n=1 Tax=Anaplasma phagocytophilum TaxID=948 RepID=UPI00200E7808|nr:alanine--tRNA ligase [Anaplasma phagocytophilum]UQD54460.1 alanine--tRNA ligase [Anaplasma phagocytophilum]
MSSSSVSGIREAFLDFFEKQGHTRYPSAPLIAEGDASLLFTNAGMVPFKQRFITGVSDVKTATTSQKCLRVGGKHNDLENVGYTNRHHTFFEMLGNFSFGDYFKETAIELAWKFVTKELGLSKERLWITVYSEDQEAFDIWKKITGYADHKIIRISTSDNFWSMGDTGPCGPCSEIFYDYGDGVSGGLPGTDESDGARYTEIWNLVFMQYNRDESGELHKLPRGCIDTGMGLERIAAVMQGVCDNYETDMFQAIIDRSRSIFGSHDHPIAHRVIADHVRAASFLIAEGLTPGNEGRNYVLRRIIRRAVRYIYQLVGDKFSLHEVVPVLTREGSAGYMANAYPEIVRAEQSIVSTLKIEEDGFADTLRRGTGILEQEIRGLKSGEVLSGEIAFKLYDTYGFPLDITLDVAKERGLKFDEDGFNRCMAKQKEQSRKHWKGSGEAQTASSHILNKHKATSFVGYENHRVKSMVKEIFCSGEAVTSMGEGEEGIAVLDITPFYAESGGQEGDTGLLNVVTAKCGSVAEVVDTTKSNNVHLHKIRVIRGTLKVGDVVEAVVDKQRREKLRANHSATHILQSVLRTLIGEGIQQKGSLVAADKLRFDFSHALPLTKEQLRTIEMEVNRQIMANQPVIIDHCSLEDAVQEGAIALFGEKYNDQNVRVVSMGSSKELCGGTHVRFTGDIGAFRIISETGIAQGVRRIEAITGHEVVSSMNRDSESLQQVAECLSVPVDQVIEKLNKVFVEQREINKKMATICYTHMNSCAKCIEVGSEIKLYVGEFSNIPVEVVASYVREKMHTNEVLAISTRDGKRTTFIVGVGESAIKRIKATDIVKALQQIQGKGGGSPSAARASLPSEYATKAAEIIRQTVIDAIQNSGA